MTSFSVKEGVKPEKRGFQPMRKKLGEKFGVVFSLTVVVTDTELFGQLRGWLVRALGRVFFVRAGKCDTLKRGVWAWAALRVAGGGGTGVIPGGVGTSTPVTAWCIGAA